MVAGPDLWTPGTQIAPGLDQLTGIDELAANITLVTPGILIPAQGALPFHKPVRKEPLTTGAVQLVHAVLPGAPALSPPPSHLRAQPLLAYTCYCYCSIYDGPDLC